MSRPLAFVLVVSIVLSSLPAGAAAVATENATQEASSVSITNVTVSPDDPVPGESITITPTVKNLANSESNVEISSVYIRERSRGGELELARNRQLGSLNPGSSTDIPMTVRFEETGTKRLLVTVNVVNDMEQRTRVTYPVIVRIDEQHPQLDIDANDTVASTEQRGEVSVANGLDSNARNVEVTLSGTGNLTVSNPRTVSPRLASGERTTAPFRYEAPSAGTYQIRARLEYNVPGGETRRTATTVPVEVEPLRRNVVLDATTTDGEPTVSADVINRGNVPIENVTVVGSATNASVPQQYLGEIPAQSSRSIQFNASLDGASAAVQLRAHYEVADETGTTTDSVELTRTPGEIDLTDLTVRPEGNRLSITGSASNVGLTEASSVRVRVQDTDAVTPAAPREYFAGRVPASDFVTFEVFARTAGNVSEIPLEVTYLVDGERHTETVRVAVDAPAPSPGPQPTRNSSGGLLVPAIGALVVLGVLGAIVYGWRNRGGA